MGVFKLWRWGWLCTPILRKMDQGRGIDEDHTTILDRANPIFYSAAVALIFFTLLTLRCSLFVCVDNEAILLIV